MTALSIPPMSVIPPTCKGQLCNMPMPLSPEVEGWRDGYCFECVTELERERIREEQSERRYKP